MKKQHITMIISYSSLLAVIVFTGNAASEKVEKENEPAAKVQTNTPTTPVSEILISNPQEILPMTSKPTN